MLEFRQLDIEGVFEITPKKIGDNRGFFSEVYNQIALAEVGIDLDFIQDNHSFSEQKGVLRGLHFQSPPVAQDKLVRVVRGRVFDVAVDIRTGSPSYAQWVGVELSAEKWNQLLVPAGFAHGFLTLEPNCEVLYKVTAPYSKEQEGSIRFDDQQIGVDWPMSSEDVIISEKDRNAALLHEIVHGFSV